MANAGTKQWLGNQEALSGDYHVFSIAGNTIDRQPRNGGNGTGYDDTGATYTLTKMDRHAVAFALDSTASNSMKSSNPRSGCRITEVAKCLDTTNPDPSKNQGGIAIAQTVAFAQNTRDEVREMPIVGALAAQPGMKQTSYIRRDMQVRRLMPIECERLQGFPDDYTKMNDKTADASRYKALGNSMAVPVMHWIGKRIDAVDTAILAR